MVLIKLLKLGAREIGGERERERGEKELTVVLVIIFDFSYLFQ